MNKNNTQGGGPYQNNNGGQRYQPRGGFVGGLSQGGQRRGGGIQQRMRQQRVERFIYVPRGGNNQGIRRGGIQNSGRYNGNNQQMQQQQQTRGNMQNMRGGRGGLRRQTLGGNAYRLGLGQVRRQLQQRNPNNNQGYNEIGRQNNQRQQQQLRQGGVIYGNRINRIPGINQKSRRINKNRLIGGGQQILGGVFRPRGNRQQLGQFSQRPQNPNFRRQNQNQNQQKNLNTLNGQQPKNTGNLRQRIAPTEEDLKALQVKAELNKLGDAPRAYLDKLQLAEAMQLDSPIVQNNAGSGSKISLTQRFEAIQDVKTFKKTLRMVPKPKIANRYNRNFQKF